MTGCSTTNTLGDETHPMEFSCQNGDQWSAEVELSDFDSCFYYRYALRDQEGRLHFEAGPDRLLSLSERQGTWHIYDFWRTEAPTRVFDSDVFKEHFFARETLSEPGTASSRGNHPGLRIQFRLSCPVWKKDTVWR